MRTTLTHVPLEPDEVTAALASVNSEIDHLVGPLGLGASRSLSLYQASGFLAFILLRTAIWVAGIALIALGIVCLYLSDAVVTGWWQGTLDAFGVGFIVGGLIDVLAISGLTYVQERQRAEDERLSHLIAEAGRLSQQRRTPETADETLQILKNSIAEAERLSQQRRTPETAEEILQILKNSIAEAERLSQQRRTPETLKEALQILENSWPYLDQPRRDEVLRLLYLPPRPKDS
jgi:hypothetical protein